MSEKKWLVPDVVDPEAKVCVQLEIPNDVKHIAAFWGALGLLSKAYNWEDSYGNGSQAAYVWRDIIEQAAQDVRDGVNCDMPIDCDEVETCLEASPIIAALQAQVTSNDTDIVNLQTQDGIIMATLLIHETELISLDNRVGGHDTDIAALQAADITHANDIIALYAENVVQDGQISDLQDADTALAVSIANNAIAIGNNTFSIANLNLRLIDVEALGVDHEARIDALEAAGPGGSGVAGIRTTSYHTSIPNNSSYDSTPFADKLYGSVTHQFIYESAQIIVSQEHRYDLATPNRAFFRLRLEAAIGEHVATLSGTSRKPVHLSELFTNIDTSEPLEIAVQWASGQEGTKVKNIAHTNILWTIIEYGSALPNPYIVDFDDGYDDFVIGTTDVTRLAVSTPVSGGNPSGCLEVEFLQASTWFFEYGFVDIDLGADRVVTDIMLDEWTDMANDKSTRVTILADDVQIMFSPALDHVQGEWVNWDVRTDMEDIFPFVCRNLKIGFSGVTGPLPVPSLIRIDNIVVDVE